MHHPWRALRALSDWTLTVSDLPAGMRGRTHWPSRTITLRPGLNQAQRRSVLAHELLHVERGPVLIGWQCQEEHRVRVLTARRLIPLDRLIDAARWSLDVHEMADELWVDVSVLRDRLGSLSPWELDVIVLALDR